MKISTSNYFLTVVTTSLVLFFLGLFLFIFLQGRQLVDSLKENANIILELDEGISVSRKDSLRSLLESDKAIITGSIRYVSKEEALESLENSMDIQWLNNESENPLHDMFQFNLSREFIQQEYLQEMQDFWSGIEGSKTLVYQVEFYDDLSGSLRKVSVLILVMVLLFSFISVLLIHNTFFFRLNADRIKIRTMELVGAEWDFIRRPYIRESYRVAFYSWFASNILLLLLYLLFKFSFPEISAYFSVLIFCLVVLITGFISWGICTLSTKILVNRYLHQQNGYTE